MHVMNIIFVIKKRSKRRRRSVIKYIT